MFNTEQVILDVVVAAAFLLKQRAVQYISNRAGSPSCLSASDYSSNTCADRQSAQTAVNAYGLLCIYFWVFFECTGWIEK